MKHKYILSCILTTMLFFASVSLADLYLINAIDDNAIYVNNIEDTIIPIQIPHNNISSKPSNLEPGIVVDISCPSPDAIQINSATPLQTTKFNARYEQILQRVISYDPNFIEKIQQAYSNSPSENLLLKAILSNTLDAVSYANITYANKPYGFASLQYLCFHDGNYVYAGPLAKDRQFLVQLGKDIVSGTRIIPRNQRGANEDLSKPYVSRPTIPADPDDSQDEVRPPTLSDTIRTNYLLNFQDLDEPRTIDYAFNESYRPLEYFPADRIIIHHTAGKLARTAAEGEAYMRSVHNYHGKTLGRGDIGYHFLIDGEGNIYEGRRGGMHSVGAHVLGHNRGSIGISLMSDAEYTIPMLVSLVELTNYLAEQYDIDISRKDMFKNRDLTGLEQTYPVLAHKELTPAKPVDPMISMDMFRTILVKVQQSPRFVNSIPNNHILDTLASNL